MVATFTVFQDSVNWILTLWNSCLKKHYGRKNIGYLLAIRNGATVILETDDDNYAHPEFWNERTRQIKAHAIANKGWINVYEYYTKARIWPRGFALEKLQDALPPLEDFKEVLTDCPIQQGLANKNPDVDAIYRLILPIATQFWRKTRSLSEWKPGVRSAARTQPGSKKPFHWCTSHLAASEWLISGSSFYNASRGSITGAFFSCKLPFGRKICTTWCVISAMKFPVYQQSSHRGNVEQAGSTSGAGSVGQKSDHVLSRHDRSPTCRPKEIPLVEAWLRDCRNLVFIHHSVF